jgi:hypothetical protein
MRNNTLSGLQIKAFPKDGFALNAEDLVRTV